MSERFIKKLMVIALFLGAAAPVIFAQVDVARETLAITYPLDDKIKVDFRGTTRFPRMKGGAEVKRTAKNGTQIKLSVSKMPRPFELGRGYATYVLWAISPNGQIDNLGEIKRRSFWEFDSTISVTTPLQTFALIVTAEPHFLVSRPSQEIMLENLRPYAPKSTTISSSAMIQYFGNSSDYFRDPNTPEIAEVNYQKLPSSILQAKQAIALAKFAGAERDAPNELSQAVTLLTNAENGFEAGRDEEYVDIAARKSISMAVLAENTANAGRVAREKRNDKLRQDAELRDAEDKLAASQEEVARLKEALGDETRTRELSERDKLNYLTQISDLKTENKNLRDQLEDYKIRFALIESKERETNEAKNREDRINKLNADESNVIQTLKKFGMVKKTDSGIVLQIDEEVWSGIRVSGFSDLGNTKFDQLGTVIAGLPDYRVIVESHTDDNGAADEQNLLTSERAGAVADKLVSKGVGENRVESKGYGGTIPLVQNSTKLNRAKNRRVYVILVPSI